MIIRDRESSDALLIIERDGSVLTHVVKAEYETAVSGQRGLQPPGELIQSGLETSLPTTEPETILAALIEEISEQVILSESQRAELQAACELLFSLQIFEKLPGTEFPQLYSNVLHVFIAAFTDLPDELQQYITAGVGQDWYWIKKEKITELAAYIDMYPQLLALVQYSPALLASLRFLAVPAELRATRMLEATQTTEYALDVTGQNLGEAHVNF